MLEWSGDKGVAGSGGEGLGGQDEARVRVDKSSGGAKVLPAVMTKESLSMSLSLYLSLSSSQLYPFLWKSTSQISFWNLPTLS